jgi:hypothetical protein
MADVAPIGGKKWYSSYTLWGNFLAAIALFLNAQYGIQLSPETQVIIMGVLNAVFRAITKKPLVL